MKQIPFRIVGIETSDFFLKEGLSLSGGQVNVNTTISFAVSSRANLLSVR